LLPLLRRRGTMPTKTVVTSLLQSCTHALSKCPSNPNQCSMPTGLHVGHIMGTSVLYLMKILGYVNMTPPKNDLVVEDCDAALGFDPNYIKALNRRAGALEALERFEESLRGQLSSFSLALCLALIESQTIPPLPSSRSSRTRELLNPLNAY
jgi:hypothetical protein